MLLPLLASLLVLWAVQHYLAVRRLLRLPSPGNYVPGLGHILKLIKPEFSADPVNAMWKLYRENQRGGLMWIRSFSLDIVFCGDYDLLKTLFNHPHLQDRISINIPAFQHHMIEERMISPGIEIPGVLLSNGKVWADQRRFTLRTLRDFGFGKAGMEELISEEVCLFIEEIKRADGAPFDFINKFNLPILNALWMVTVGQRFEYNDERLISIIERLTELFKRLAAPSNVVHIVLPWVSKIYPKFLDRDKTIATNQDIMNLMISTIKEHEETLDPNEPRDFTDKVLLEIGRTTDPSSSFFGDVGKENLANSLMDMFLAGSETTSTTLTWAMLYMVRYPSVQERVQEELDRVVGRGRAPSLKDRLELPYTEAVVMEIQRYANIVPQGVNHCSKKDVTVDGVTIPAGTLVMPLFVELLKGSYWGDGTTFRPERFLDEEGKCRKDDHLIPFSIGKRQCLGETLAKAELFLFFTGILQQFLVRPEVEGLIPSEDYNNGITILPKPFKLRLTNRS